MVLSLLSSPLCMKTDDFGTSKNLESSFSTALFAFPSSGAAVTYTLTSLSPYCPDSTNTVFLDAFGETLTRKRTIFVRESSLFIS